MLVPSSNPLISALLAGGALLLVVALCRWTFSTAHRTRREEGRRRRAALGGDYGLLRPAVTVDSRLDANVLRERLCEAGLRATVAPDGVGGFAVLVFAHDVERARDVLTDAA